MRRQENGEERMWSARECGGKNSEFKKVELARELK